MKKVLLALSLILLTLAPVDACWRRHKNKASIPPCSTSTASIPVQSTHTIPQPYPIAASFVPAETICSTPQPLSYEELAFMRSFFMELVERFPSWASDVRHITTFLDHEASKKATTCDLDDMCRKCISSLTKLTAAYLEANSTDQLPLEKTIYTIKMALLDVHRHIHEYCPSTFVASYSFPSVLTQEKLETEISTILRTRFKVHKEDDFSAHAHRAEDV